MDPNSASAGPSKEEAAEQAWREISEAEEAQQRRDQAGQRNSIIAVVLGVATFIVGGILAMSLTDWRGEPAPETGQIVAVLGVILIALGIYFRGKRRR